MKSRVIPESWLRLMKPEDRKALGQLTAEEAVCAFSAKSEKILQRQIVSLLRLKGIEPLVPVFGKATRINTGWTDITFAACYIAHLWEVKLPGQTLSPEQTSMRIKLTSWPNSWRYRVITSVDEARAELKAMGLE